MNRRGFLQACLASAAAPYVVTTAGVLMPVRKLAGPGTLTEEALERLIAQMSRDAAIAVQPTKIIFPARFAEILGPSLEKVWKDAYKGIDERETWL